MAATVHDKKEVYLAGTRFPIKDRVRPQMVGRFPQKMLITNYTYDNEMLLSGWIIDDQTEGMLIEEMDINTDKKRCYWTTCDISHKGHILLPPLATAISLDSYALKVTDPGMETWTNATTLTNWTFTDTSSGGGTHSAALSQGTTTDADTGTYSACITMVNAGGTASGTLVQTLTTWSTAYRGKEVTFKFKGKVSNADASITLKVEDGVGSTTSSGVTDTSFAVGTVTHTFDAAATQCKLTFTATQSINPSTYTAHIDSVYTDLPYVGSTYHFCNFNSNLYLGTGNCLFKLNSGTGAAYTFVESFLSNPAGSPDGLITTLCSSLASMLYIGFGDTKYYQYMTTAEAFTETNVADASFFIEMDSTHLAKMDADGNIWTATTPNAATPTWTTKGSITGIAAGSMRAVCLAPDVSGNPIIYATTTTGLFAHDYANTLFYATDVSFPVSSTNGYGLCYWQGYIFVSYGVSVIAYSPTAGTVAEVGLNNDDGLAAWDNAGMYISRLIATQHCIYALTHIVGSGYTAVYKYDGKGWQKQFTSTSTGYSMHDGIVSDVYAYRLWFDFNGSIYYIAEQSTPLCPKKISGYTYDDDSNGAGVHVTPWFNAGSLTDIKIAKKVDLTSSGCAATETIAVYYRIDHISSTSLTSDWTALGSAITSNTTTTANFGSGAGIAFKAIQFKFVLVRGSTSTNSPDILSFKFYYLMDASPRWQWSFTADCSNVYLNKSPKTLEAALITSTEATTLQEFEIHDGTAESGEVHYVKVISCSGQVDTGQVFNGIYEVTVVEP